MSDAVVIRCPQCGTTQPALGECDACHEADARYFCTNHTPGRWLDGPACPACGARHGVRARVEPLPPAPPAAGRRPPAAAPPAPTPPRPRPAPPRRRPPPARPTIPAEPRADEWEEIVVDRGVPPWLRGRGWPTRERLSDELPSFPVVRVGAGTFLGCLARLVMSLVAFVALAALAFFGYCGAW